MGILDSPLPHLEPLATQDIAVCLDTLVFLVQALAGIPDLVASRDILVIAVYRGTLATVVYLGIPVFAEPE